MDRLFVGFKPAGLSSNAFLSKIKKKYGYKKAGFSGTLDPFARGCLLIGFGKYTKLFRFLPTSPKIYEAVLWLGAFSPSFDTQNIKINCVDEVPRKNLEKITDELKGVLSYIPPKFSAKKIDGVRAYKRARNGEDFSLKPTTMQVYEATFLNYNHPFLTLRLSVSKGAYIRSYSQLFAKKLGMDIALCALKRESEGEFSYEGERPLNPLDFIKLQKNFINDEEILKFGRKIALNSLKIQADGEYVLETKDFFSIICVKNQEVYYHLNKVGKC